MTRRTNARIAGFTFLFYIVAGIASMVLYGQASSGDGIADKLASIAQHASQVRVTVLLTLLTSSLAVVLGVTPYGITRDEDHELAMLAPAWPRRRGTARRAQPRDDAGTAPARDGEVRGRRTAWRRARSARFC